ncbi:type II toxin-antitoxin system YafQ family toxin [Desulfoplanes sp. PS50]
MPQRCQEDAKAWQRHEETPAATHSFDRRARCTGFLSGHPLKGNWLPFWDAHIEPDWLLVYLEQKGEL